VITVWHETFQFQVEPERSRKAPRSDQHQIAGMRQCDRALEVAGTRMRIGREKENVQRPTVAVSRKTGHGNGNQTQFKPY
jgi:hypothetical protein